MRIGALVLVAVPVVWLVVPEVLVFSLLDQVIDDVFVVLQFVELVLLEVN